MYTNYNSNLEKNQMMTPPIIGLTSSIVNDKLNNIKLEDNSTGLFKIEDSKIKPIVEMPIETNNFIISGTDEDIDSNENNAVNKRYLLNKCVGKDDQTVTFYNINTKRIKFLNDNGNLVINTTSFSYPDGDSRIYFPAICLNNIFYILNDRIFTDKPISLYTNTGIEFNTNSNGEIIDSTFQKTCLKNLVTSEMTTELRKQLILNKLMDNVCPTYRFCENNYAKTDDINFVYETLDTKVNNDYLTTNYYTKTEVDAKFPSYQYCENTYLSKADAESTYVKIGSSSGSHQKHILREKLNSITSSINASQILTDLAKMNVNSKVQSGCWNINFRIILSLTSSLSNLLPLSQGLMFCLRRKTSTGSFQNTQLLGSSIGMYSQDRKLEFRIIGTIDDIFDASEITSDEFILSYSNTSSISITNTNTTYNWLVDSPEQTFIKL